MTVSDVIWWFGAITGAVYALAGTTVAIMITMEYALKRLKVLPVIVRFYAAELKAKRDKHWWGA